MANVSINEFMRVNYIWMGLLTLQKRFPAFMQYQFINLSFVYNAII